MGVATITHKKIEELSNGLKKLPKLPNVLIAKIAKWLIFIKKNRSLSLLNSPQILLYHCCCLCVCVCIATLLCVFHVDLLKCYYYIKAFVSIIMGGWPTGKQW